MYTPLRCAAPAGEVRGARAALTLRACRLMHAQARRTTKSVTINTDELSDDEEYNKVPTTHQSMAPEMCVILRLDTARPSRAVASGDCDSAEKGPA
jgi:hypothetical protein